MNAIEHKGNEAFQVSTLVDPENDPMSIRSLFNKAANAVIDASSLRGEVQALRDDVQGLRDTVNRLVRERDEMKSERDQAKAELDDLHNRIQLETCQHNRQVEALTDRLDRRADTLSAMEAERDSLKEQLGHVVRERDTLKTDLLAECEDKNKVLNDLQDVRSRLDTVSRDRDDWQLKTWTAEEEARKRSDEIGRLTTETDHQRALITSHDATIATLKEDVAQWRFGAQNANDELNFTKGKLSDISAILAR